MCIQQYIKSDAKENYVTRVLIIVGSKSRKLKENPFVPFHVRFPTGGLIFKRDMQFRSF